MDDLFFCFCFESAKLHQNNLLNVFMVLVLIRWRERVQDAGAGDQRRKGVFVREEEEWEPTVKSKVGILCQSVLLSFPVFEKLAVTCVTFSQAKVLLDRKVWTQSDLVSVFSLRNVENDKCCFNTNLHISTLEGSKIKDALNVSAFLISWEGTILWQLNCHSISRGSDMFPSWTVPPNSNFIHHTWPSQGGRVLNISLSPRSLTLNNLTTKWNLFDKLVNVFDFILVKTL